MAAGRVVAGQGPPGQAEVVYQDLRTRVTRVAGADGRTMIHKQPLGPDADRRLQRETAVLQRLAGVAGVAQLGGQALAEPGVIVLVDAGAATLAAVAKPLPMKELGGLALRLARAVAGMHARGVMHRSICPANIVLDPDGGAAYLVGFGLATVVAEVQPEFTHPSQILSELAYLAPEQTGRTGLAVDERADLYALGATLYELATGAPPFGSGDPLQLIRDHLTRIPTPPAVANPAVPVPLSQIIGHLLEKEPDRRYQSAEGLVYDLERALAAAGLLAGAEFRIGECDVPSRLVAPSRLVGRDEETGVLAAALEDALSGRCRSVLVAGAPGVGKTALVDQLRPAVTGRDGWFVAGKFDQYRRDLEFDAVHQALRALGRLLLAEPEAELSEVRGRLLAALGPNAGLTTAVLPEFAALLGVPPDPGDPLTAQARAQWVPVQILRAVTSPERPVLMFLDDLQWAGRTPLGVVDMVLSGEPVDGLLLVGAYRDNEVDAAHPLSALVSRWRGQAEVRSLWLTNLPLSALVAMVAEMLDLDLDPDAAAGLGELTAPHTGGNPHETVELLNALRRGGVLATTTAGWRWHPAAVRAYLDRADPARLLAGRLGALPARSRQIVEAMACLGGQVELNLLATAAGVPRGAMQRFLGPALDDGLLVGEAETFAAVRFRHDRIREAVLAALDPHRRRALHLTMARRLAQAPEWFAAAAEQYLPVVDAVTEAAERRRVVALLRHAAEQAGLIGEYVLVSGLLGAAVRLIEPDEAHTAVPVRIGRHAALFSAGRLDEADKEYAALDALGTTPAERADAAAVQVLSLVHRGRFAEAVAVGLDALRELGVALPVAGRFGEDLDRQFGHLQRWLERTDIADELGRPEITDPALLATIHLLNAVSPAVNHCGDHAADAWLGLESMRIWLDHGPAPRLVGAAGTAFQAAVALRGDESVVWLRALRQILALGETRGYEPGTSVARFLYGSMGWRLDPVEESARACQRAREGLIAGGELTIAAFTYHAATYYLLDSASSLETVAAEIRAGLAFTDRTGNEVVGAFLAGYRWLVTVLRGERSGKAETVPVDRYAGNPVALFHAHITRGIAAAVFGDLVGLAQHSAAAMPVPSAAHTHYAPAVVRLLRGLALAEQARTADRDDRDRLMAGLDEITSWLGVRAGDAPANFGHLVRLLEAERAWAVGDFPTAELAFDAALREVADRQRPWHQALITEHAARFYLTRGLGHLGHRLLADARAHYAAWGATAKVAQLDWAYPTLHSAADTTSGHDQVPARGQLPGRASAGAVTSGTIDLLGILSASQALSSETTLPRLHSRVADTLAAITGATHVCLLLWSEEQQQWLTPSPGGGATPLVSGYEHTASMSVLRYLHRTGEPLLVADATSDDRFARDPYFASLRHCALLAVPVHSRGTLRAVLLLENRLLRGAFTADRLDAVTLIAGQLAVSLDNANLYAELTASRARIVTTADTTRKRIERDLHDGAQQRLVSLVLQLSAAQGAVRPDQRDLAAALARVATEADAATQELREIAHGLHPGILSTNGLRPALRTLARRAPIPVDLDVRIPGRLPEQVEIGAYYLITEALTNATKHAHATNLTVIATVDTGLLQVTVEDDGVGGADLNHGTGLLGLKDRVEALGGRLTLLSPAGEGTRLHAQLPLTTGDAPADALSG